MEKQSRRTKGRGIVGWLEIFFRQIQNSNTTYDGWTNGLLTILYKNKGEETDLKNYRPLSIMNVDYKLFTDILMQRLVKALGEAIGIQQTAFLPGRIIDDNIRTIQGLIARHDKTDHAFKREGIGVLFLDQEKAYDRVSHEFLWAVLDKLGIPLIFIS